MLRQVSKRLTAEALSSVLDSSNRVTTSCASRSAELDGVGVIRISHVGQGQWSLVRPAAPVSHVSSIGVVVDRRRSSVETGVGVRIVTVLLARVSHVIRSVAVTVEVVLEQTSLTRSRSHHGTAVVTRVDKVDGVTVAAGRVRAGWRESLDEVEESLIAVGASGARST